MSSSRLIASICLLACVVCALPDLTQADIITGQITDWRTTITTPASQNRRVLGDGVNHVTGCWTMASNYYDAGATPPAGVPAESVWLYSSDYVGSDDTDVAWAQGVTDVSQIVDASAYTFVPPLGSFRFATAQGNPDGSGIGWFAVLRNVNTGYYGVLRCDDLRTVIVGRDRFFYFDATWWFQTDGSANFSSVPEPASLSLLGLGALALLRRR